MRLPVTVFLACSVVGMLAAGDEVRVYTNADLEKYGPPPSIAMPPAQDDDRGWDLVTEFIERERERLDADRTYELNRLSLDLARRDGDRRRSAQLYRGAYAGYPFYPYSARHGRGRGERSTLRTGGSPRDIAPLHAGPTPAERHRSRAIRNKGADAFPVRSPKR